MCGLWALSNSVYRHTLCVKMERHTNACTFKDSLSARYGSNGQWCHLKNKTRQKRTSGQLAEMIPTQACFHREREVIRGRAPTSRTGNASRRMQNIPAHALYAVAKKSQVHAGSFLSGNTRTLPHTVYSSCIHTMSRIESSPRRIKLESRAARRL